MNDLDTVMSVSTLQGFAVAKLGMDVQRLFKPEQLASIERYFEERGA